MSGPYHDLSAYDNRTVAPFARRTRPKSKAAPRQLHERHRMSIEDDLAHWLRTAWYQQWLLSNTSSCALVPAASSSAQPAASSSSPRPSSRPQPSSYLDHVASEFWTYQQILDWYILLMDMTGMYSSSIQPALAVWEEWRRIRHRVTPGYRLGIVQALDGELRDRGFPPRYQLHTSR